MALVCNGVIDQAPLETLTVSTLRAVAVNLKIPNGTRKQAIIDAIIAQHVLIYFKRQQCHSRNRQPCWLQGRLLGRPSHFTGSIYVVSNDPFAATQWECDFLDSFGLKEFSRSSWDVGGNGTFLRPPTRTSAFWAVTSMTWGAARSEIQEVGFPLFLLVWKAYPLHPNLSAHAMLPLSNAILRYSPLCISGVIASARNSTEREVACR